MNTARAVLHVGLPKTGTSFLQGTMRANSEVLARGGVHLPTAEGERLFLAVLYLTGRSQAWGRSAERGQKDLDRLTLAREVLGLQLNGRRSTSRLPALVDLLLSKPLISVPLAAKALKVSPQAVEGMIGQLGSSARELTGRGRYRAWGIV